MTLTKLTTRRFGEIEFSQEDLVTFPQGLVGFGNLINFVLIQHKEGSHFYWLQSVESPELAFLVTDPAVYVANYSPEMPDNAAELLNLQPETPQVVYTIVNIPSGQPEELTLNLAGPIVINAESRTGLQIVLEDTAYPIRFKPLAKREAA